MIDQELDEWRQLVDDKWTGATVRAVSTALANCAQSSGSDEVLAGWVTLAELARCTPAAVMGAMTHLEAAGFVRRRRHRPGRGVWRLTWPVVGVERSA